MLALELGQCFGQKPKWGLWGGGVQNCWNNIKVIPLSGLEIKIIHISFNSGMMQTSF